MSPQLSLENRPKFPFLLPPSLPLKGDVVYGWSLSTLVCFKKRKNSFFDVVTMEGISPARSQYERVHNLILVAKFRRLFFRDVYIKT